MYVSRNITLYITADRADKYLHRNGSIGLNSYDHYFTPQTYIHRVKADVLAESERVRDIAMNRSMHANRIARYSRRLHTYIYIASY